MNSIWLKIAGVAVIAVIVIVVIGRLQSDKPAAGPAAPTETRPPERTRTFADVAERDKQFATAPKPAEDQPVEQPAPAATPPAPQPAQPPAQTPPPVADGYVMPSSLVPGTKLYCKPLSEEEEIAAEQLLPWTATTRSIGRLPMMGTYGMTVRSCRDILSRWPDSRYAYRAKQILEDISTSARSTGQNITRQEMDVSRFLKPRPGTEQIPADQIRR